MKKYQFIDFIEGVKRQMTIKSSTFEGAIVVANAFMTDPACIGWGPCNG